MDWSSLTLGEERGCFADDCHNTQPGKLPPEIPLRAAGGILTRRGLAVALLLSAVSCYLCGEVCRSWFVSGQKMLVVQELSWKGLQLSVHLRRACGRKAQNKDLKTWCWSCWVHPGTDLKTRPMRSFFLSVRGKKHFNPMTKISFPIVPLLCHLLGRIT